MPVKTDKLLQLLCLMFLTYWLIKALIVSMSVSEDSVQACTPAQDQEMNYFKIEKIDADTVKYKSKLKFKQFLKGLEEDKKYFERIH